MKKYAVIILFLSLCSLSGCFTITSRHAYNDSRDFNKQFEVENRLRNRPGDYKEYKKSQDRKKTVIIIDDSVDTQSR